MLAFFVLEGYKEWPTSRCNNNTISIGHVNNIPTVQFFTGFSRNTQSKSYAIIDWVCPGFPKWCIVGCSLTRLITIKMIKHFCIYFFNRDKHSDKVLTLLLDALSSVLSDADSVSIPLLDAIFVNIVEPNKVHCSTTPGHC